jgi:hypothetical protein
MTHGMVVSSAMFIYVIIIVALTYSTVKARINTFDAKIRAYYWSELSEVGRARATGAPGSKK